MDVTDLYDNIQTWLSIYEENLHVNEPQASKTQDQLKWETNMLRIIKPFSVPDSLMDTPARAHIQQAVAMAAGGDTAKLQEIYKLCKEIEAYLK